MYHVCILILVIFEFSHIFTFNMHSSTGVEKQKCIIYCHQTTFEHWIRG